MKKEVLHIISFLMAAIIFYTTTGVSVHKMYCYCKDEFATSLIHIEDDCETSSLNSGVCCSNASCNSDSESTDHECSDCQKETVLFKEKFFYSTAKVAINLPDFFIPKSNLLKTYTLQQQESGYKKYYTKYNPPPTLYSQPWLQTFLC
jgi:hypothetical protein